MKDEKKPWSCKIQEGIGGCVTCHMKPKGCKGNIGMKDLFGTGEFCSECLRSKDNNGKCQKGGPDGTMCRNAQPEHFEFFDTGEHPSYCNEIREQIKIRDEGLYPRMSPL